MQRIGILGGTFDPVHLGHLIPAQYALEYLGLDRLLLVPSAAPVHRPLHVPDSTEHRLRMCELAADSIPRFEA
ncbi:MAG: adenylyltransferase/cytidyltransferase family protein [Planctomycetota bacterium]|nr:adenylyltransferase/cytidyltransferase family protein [Planctomycetota bacterium]